jgi:hypothetical protein
MRYRNINRGAVFLLLTFLVSTASAEQRSRLGGPLIDGSVVRAAGCGSHFFVAYRDDYALADWLGGTMVRENEVLQSTSPNGGNFEREGIATMNNLTTGKPITFVIVKALIQRTEFEALINKFCG